MAQDIRKMFQDYEPEQAPKLSEGHEMRFEHRLKREFPKKKQKPSFFWLKIAAAVIAFVAIGYLVLQNGDETTVDAQVAEAEDAIENTAPQLTLGDLSPDLKKVEQFYLAGIEVQLASLPQGDENKELIDGFMKQLEDLNKEYKRLNLELNEVGPTEATINALIDNLKLRLELLFKLKNKLKELKTLENEKFTEIDA